MRGVGNRLIFTIIKNSSKKITYILEIRRYLCYNSGAS